MPLPIEPGTAFAAHVEQHMHHDRIAWLVTVDADGTPQPSPIWFLWDADSILIFSRPDTGKVRNIAVRPRVAIHFNGDNNGGHIVVLTGLAALAPDAPPANAIPDYLEKYRAGLLDIGMTPDSFAAEYSAAIRIVPERIRGH